jgi:hypothetical protein
MAKKEEKKTCLESIAYEFSVLICFNGKENPEGAFSRISAVI